MRKRGAILIALCALGLSFFAGASALAGEEWESNIPKPIAHFFEGPEWDGYACIDGYAHYPVTVASETFDNNIAYLIMQRGKSYTYCILQQQHDREKWIERSNQGLTNPEEGQVDPWVWKVKSQTILPYRDHLIPVLDPTDSTSWTGVSYDYPDGYREYLTFGRPDGETWLLLGYRKLLPGPPYLENFSVRIDPEKYYEIQYGPMERVNRALDEGEYDHRFLVTWLEKGEYLYDNQAFYGTLNLDLNIVGIGDFPITLQEVQQILYTELNWKQRLLAK